MYYVTMTDKFMSGWGRAQSSRDFLGCRDLGKIPLTNKLIFLCDTFAEAQAVADNAEARSDQKHVNICGSKPSYYRTTMGSDYETGNYYVQIKTPDDYPSWYVPGYFK